MEILLEHSDSIWRETCDGDSRYKNHTNVGENLITVGENHLNERKGEWKRGRQRRGKEEILYFFSSTTQSLHNSTTYTVTNTLAQTTGARDQPGKYGTETLKVNNKKISNKSSSSLLI